MAEELNKLELLIKVMKMTTATEDTVSLVALRKANAMLKAEGWDWDRLLRGKVKVISDPFGPSAVKAPPMDFGRPTASSTPPRPQPAPRPQPQPQAAPWTQAQPRTGRATGANFSAQPPWPQQNTPNPGLAKENVYAGNCRGCSNYVGVRAGKVVKQGNAWKLFCVACSNKSANQPRSTNLDDLLGGAP